MAEKRKESKMVLRKKEVYTVITPIPGFIPRQLAIDILHSHGEVITLNPLVLSFKPIKAPRDAPSDEFYSTWYEITERIQFIPGIGKMGSGIINFNGCFHDMPWGLQTHTYAPAGVDLRNKYRIGGNQPGIEPPEQPEIGMAKLGVPKEGLYLREDIEIRCNFAMVGFVKDQLKAASKEMVERIIKKAELLDAGILTAMIENGRLKTQNPMDRSSLISGYPGSVSGASMSPPLSPTSSFQQMRRESSPCSPNLQYKPPRPLSYQPAPTMYQQQQYPGHRPMSSMSARPGYPSGAQLAPPPPVIMELPGDMYHPPPQSQPSPTSTAAGTDRWSQSQSGVSQQSSRPTSYHSDMGAYPSPGQDYGKYATELATHRETPEEYNASAPHPLAVPSNQNYAAYNPANYARMSR